MTPARLGEFRESCCHVVPEAFPSSARPTAFEGRYGGEPAFRAAVDETVNTKLSKLTVEDSE